ncbi:MAG: hypothetical protein ACRDBG_18935, partial [Waterburya sp.]
IRNGKKCSIDIDTTNKTIANSATNGCLLSTRVLDNLIQLNSSRTNIVFSAKGNITIDPANPTPVLVVSIPDGGTNQQRCIVIENVLGSLRTGNYSGTIRDAASPVFDNCQKQE